MTANGVPGTTALVIKENMEPKKLTYQEAKKRLDELFDVVEKTNIHQLPDLFHELLTTYNAMDNFLFDLFNDEESE